MNNHHISAWIKLVFGYELIVQSWPRWADLAASYHPWTPTAIMFQWIRISKILCTLRELRYFLHPRSIILLFGRIHWKTHGPSVIRWNNFWKRCRNCAIGRTPSSVATKQNVPCMLHSNPMARPWTKPREAIIVKSYSTRMFSIYSSVVPAQCAIQKTVDQRNDAFCCVRKLSLTVNGACDFSWWIFGKSCHQTSFCPDK